MKVLRQTYTVTETKEGEQEVNSELVNYGAALSV